MSFHTHKGKHDEQIKMIIIIRLFFLKLCNLKWHKWRSVCVCVYISLPEMLHLGNQTYVQIPMKCCIHKKFKFRRRHEVTNKTNVSDICVSLH
jgi:hypothetical protein